jgi:MHS family proline/betaine transporter-like MFS transporter
MASIFFGMLYGLPTRIFNALLPIAIGIDGHVVMIINTIFLVVYLILLVFFGIAADRYGTEKVMRAALTTTMLLSYPLILIIETKSIGGLIIAKTLFAILSAGFIGPFHAWAQRFFRASSRYQQISTAYAAGKCFSTLFLACTILLYEHFQSLSVIALVLIVCATLTRRFFHGYSKQPIKTLSYNEY